MSSPLAFAGTSLTSLPAFPSATRSCQRLMTVVMATAGRPSVARTVRGNPYELLQVEETASAVEIKAAYRSLAKRFHPDVFVGGGSNGSEFLEIQQAFATLSDPATRERYDQSNRTVGFGVGFGFAGDGQNRSRRWETDQCW